MEKIFRTIAVCTGVCLASTGCGTGVTLIALVSPSISQVSPQVVTAGTPAVTLTVQGSNFSASSALTVNGAAVPTSFVSATTLAAKISGSTLAQPNVAKLQVRNTNGSQSNQVSLTVASLPTSPQALAIATPSLPGAQIGVHYSGSFAAMGGTPGYTWAVTSGSLPAGMTLTSAGVLSGTPTTAGTSTFVLTVTDSSSPAQKRSVTLSLVVSPVTQVPATLVANSVTLGAGKVGSPYAASLSASGGTPGYTWTLASGSLPAGLALSSAGVISGTPTAAGSATFKASVSDSGSPAQTASVSESLTVAAPSLTMSSGALGAGKTGSAYSVSLSAAGGTPGYTWSIASGSLPAGLSLSRGGVISGTPTAAGSATFTVSVSDSGSPVQTASAQESIAVATTPLSITAGTLAGGQAGTQYTAALSATGGIPGYTWSVTSGALPPGLALSSDGVISGTPTTTGSSTFTVGVTDSGSPVQNASMPISIAVSAAQSASGTTWYVRPDGGTRYSSAYTSGQCDGQADQSYAAAVAANGGTAATNMHCAFNDVRFLWQDGSYYGYWNIGWVVAGGDTVIIRGSIADGVSYRIGWDTGSGYCANGAPCFGFPGDSADSGPPPLPGGTPGHPTRILGGNYGSCTAQSARTQLHGGYGLYAVLDLRGAANLDVECLDITDFSSCGQVGQAVPCNRKTAPYDDFASYGIRLSNAITNATFTDIRIHGVGVEGMVGPVGDAVTFTDLAIVGNAGGGWNADDGTVGSGNLLVQNFDISWNGCAEEYPLVDPLPYSQCTDDMSASHGGSGNGYGDGFGTTTQTGTVAWHIKFENGLVSYNTQDGLDALHASGAGSTTTADRILAYGNMGNQIKIGSDGGSTITNNVIFSNCEAMSNTIPGTPSGYNALLSDFCRADDEAIIVSMNDGSTSTVAGNTIYGFREGTHINSWGDLGGIVCAGKCTTADKIIYVDNVLVGFDPKNTGRFPAQYYLQDYVFAQDPFINPGSIYNNNLKYDLGTHCPDTGETNAICAAPQVNNVSWPSYGYLDVQPSSNSSNVMGSGMMLPGLTEDYTGATRSNPPSIGAYD